MLDIEQCWLTTDLGNDVRHAVRDWAREAGLPAYDQAEGTGYLRHLVYREGRNTAQVLVELVTAQGELHDADGLVAALRRFPEVRSIHHAVNETPAEVTNLPTTLLWGEEAIEEELLGLRFRIRPNAFLQTNTAMAARLYELAVDFASLTGDETVWDLYCGIGSIGLAMARERAHGLGRRHLGGVGGLRDRERRAERGRRTRRSTPATSGRRSRS